MGKFCIVFLPITTILCNFADKIALQMKHITTKTLASVLFAASQMVCLCAAAQDVDINFETLFAAGQKSPYTTNGVTFTYCAYDQGANIYMKENDFFSVKVSSASKKIVRIEFKGEIAAERYNDEITVRSANGKLTHLQSGTFVWEGKNTTVQFWGGTSTTSYYVKGLRLWFEGSEIITDEKEICATPTVDVQDGEFVFSCPTKDATYHYSVLPTRAQDGVTFDGVTISLHATAPGKDPSEEVTKTFPLTDF